ncbi:hypothetical protein DI53_3397 [Sphingobacterium deserti]|uniref:DUF1634 domain-containing protein n=2 Tax=Sphingobacterium deserti TaxID=1229276 RepID=A0A0B8T243_9SPHI|nr:hypothetical protein DI53_3397 [Sphingobacterium deserti]
MKVNDKTMQHAIGNVLKYGVWSVLLVGIIGGLILIWSHGDRTIDYTTFRENDQSIFQVVDEILHGVIRMDGRSIVYLAIIMLFLTPLFRLILSLISFLVERDYMYVIITTIVLIIIAFSVYFGVGH